VGENHDKLNGLQYHAPFSVCPIPLDIPQLLEISFTE